ncbi:hypothetical protein Q3G72_025082 [Acer saccharum]|nr:hypothetical protein Q3G72_025082 [Acer saccharum]
MAIQGLQGLKWFPLGIPRIEHNTYVEWSFHTRHSYNTNIAPQSCPTANTFFSSSSPPCVGMYTLPPASALPCLHTRADPEPSPDTRGVYPYSIAQYEVMIDVFRYIIQGIHMRKKLYEPTLTTFNVC